MTRQSQTTCKVYLKNSSYHAAQGMYHPLISPSPHSLCERVSYKRSCRPITECRNYWENANKCLKYHWGCYANKASGHKGTANKPESQSWHLCNQLKQHCCQQWSSAFINPTRRLHLSEKPRVLRDCHLCWSDDKLLVATFGLFEPLLKKGQ